MSARGNVRSIADARATRQTGLGLTSPKTLTIGELQNLPATIDLLTAAKAFGIGRSLAYELADPDRGEFPVEVLRFGSRLRVRTIDVLNALGLAPAAGQ